MHGVIKMKVLVNKIGKTDDYIHLPVIRNEKHIGVVTEARETDNWYELSITVFAKLEMSNGEPSAIILSS